MPSVFRHESSLDSSVIIQERVFSVAAVLSHHDAFRCQIRIPLENDQHTSEPVIFYWYKRSPGQPRDAGTTTQRFLNQKGKHGRKRRNRG